MRRCIGGLVLLFIAMVFVTGCGPAKLEQLVPIEPNQTAYVVPLEMKTEEGQQRFLSEDFLEKSKVAAKRISLEQRQISTGRGWWQYKYIPTQRVIIVDRTPVTRDWTVREATGTSKIDQAIWVQSLDSIDFGVGITITTSVAEKDTSKFLYHYAGKSLADITDGNVRSYITSILSSEFGALPLGNVQKVMEAATKEGKDITKEAIPTCFTKRSTVIKDAFDNAKKYFADFGLTINVMGGTEGFEFKDQKIRDAINATFTSAMAIQEEANKKESQAIINARNVGVAEAQRDAAKKFAEAADARVRQVQLEIESKNAEARLVWAQKWDGKLPPNMMPDNSNMLIPMK